MIGFFPFTPTMSIAVTAVVRSSRILFWLVSVMCASLVFVAAIIVSGRIGNLSTVAEIALGVMCIVVALYAFISVNRNRQTHVLHISGTGQIRLAALQAHELSVAGADDEQGELVRLLPVSTLWPSLLLLHLQSEQQQTRIVAVLPDSVPAESFKALSLACRWIVLRQTEAGDERKNRN